MYKWFVSEFGCEIFSQTPVQNGDKKANCMCNGVIYKQLRREKTFILVNC